MGLHAWAADQTRICANQICQPRSQCGAPSQRFLAIVPCNLPGKGPRQTLAGYCAQIWSEPVEIDGFFVGTVVSDGNAFRFFAADVRLDELDGIAWSTLPELRSSILVGRSVILAKLTSDRVGS